MVQFVLLLVAFSQSGAAQTQFPTSELAETERRILQAALALTNDYNGLIDGQLGTLTEAALTQWRTGNGYIGPVREFEIGQLIEGFIGEVRDRSWISFDIAQTRASILLPRRDVLLADDLAIARDPEGDLVFRAVHVADDFAVDVLRTSMVRTPRIHSWLEGQARPGAEVYQVNRAELLVTATIQSSGRMTYIRSDRMAGGYQTLIVDAALEAQPDLNLITGSYGFDAPIDLGIPEPGLLLSAVFAFRSQNGASSQPGPLDLAPPDVPIFNIEPQ